jgi:hypothetical protein
MTKRLAIAVDGPLDQSSLATIGSDQAELVAVMVLPPYYEDTRSSIPVGLRCTTHPKELEALGVTVCFAWRSTELIRLHGDRLRAFTDLVLVGDDLSER